MARVFTITAPSSKIALNAQGRGEIAFTVANASAGPLRGRAKLVPQDPSQKGWLTLAGEPERDFPAGGVQQFSVHVAAPAGSKPGDYTFRLDAYSVQNPDEDYAQGATVAFTVQEAKKPQPFPWWILAVAAVVLIAGGVTVWLVLRGKGQPNTATPAQAWVKVPDLTGKTLPDVNTALAQLQVNLKLGSVANVLTDVTKVDTVIKQSPPAGESAESGSTIDVQTGVAIVVIPQLVGLTYAEAVNALAAVKLDVGGNPTNANQPGAKPTQVLDSNPKAGNSVQSHTVINLTIQQATVAVPNLVGAPFQAAVAILASNNLAVGSVTGNIFQLAGFTPVPIAPVTEQYPKAGTPVQVGSPVNLVFPGASVNRALLNRQIEFARVRH